MTPVRVKICGITNREDARAAVEAGADALGFVFFRKSPRYVTPAEAGRIIETVPAFVTTVGVFVNEAPEEINGILRHARIDIAQLHGEETPAECRRVEGRVMKAFRVRTRGVLERLDDFRVPTILLDAWVPGEYGGTGARFDWEIAREAARGRVLVLSGGLSPENVAGAVRAVRPFGVDVSSGVEADGDPRRKDAGKIRMFVKEAKGGFLKSA